MLTNISTVDISQLHHIHVPVIGNIVWNTPITDEQNVNGYHYVCLNRVPTVSLFVLHCKCDSMEPLIPNGAIVTIHQQSTAETDEISVVMINGEDTLKRFKELGKVHIMLYTNDQKYEPIF